MSSHGRDISSVCVTLSRFSSLHIWPYIFPSPSLSVFIFCVSTPFFCCIFPQICFSSAMMQASIQTLSKVNYGRTSSTRPDLMTNITFTMLILYFLHIFSLDKVTSSVLKGYQNTLIFCLEINSGRKILTVKLTQHQS